MAQIDYQQMVQVVGIEKLQLLTENAIKNFYEMKYYYYYFEILLFLRIYIKLYYYYYYNYIIEE